MAYDWTPSSSRAATTVPRVLVGAHGPSKADESRDSSESSRDPPPPTRAAGDMRVAAAIEEFIEAAEDGRVLNRSGRRYRPSALRDVRGSLRFHVARDMGQMTLSEVRRQDIQALVDRLVSEGLSASRVRSVISAVRALYGYAIEHGYVDLSPATGLVISHDVEPPAGPPHETWSHAQQPAPTWTEDQPGQAWTAPEDEPTAPLAEDAPDGAWGAEEDPDAGWGGDPGTERAWGEDDPQPPGADETAEPDDHLDEARRPWQRTIGMGPPPPAADLEPIALLPDRILTFALRIVLVLFILIALVSIAESL
jgi:hypothetical protein